MLSLDQINLVNEGGRIILGFPIQQPTLPLDLDAYAGTGLDLDDIIVGGLRRRNYFGF